MNDAVYKKLRKQMHYTPQSGSGCKTLLLQMHCVIHQTSLTRKSLALGFSGLWSCLVRLAHLFESHSFRIHFKNAMRKVIGDNFFCLPADDLPSGSAAWREARIQSLRLFSDSGHSGGISSGNASRRLKALVHCKKDNGNPWSQNFCHWCLGPQCCEGGSAEAVESMVAEYERVFDRMQVPLLYRWKYAGQAIAIVRDGLFLHNILPRTLKEMNPTKQATKLFLLSIDFTMHLFFPDQCLV